MRLKFYYRTGVEGGDPLVAVASIPGNGNQGYPWPEGQIEFYDVDLEGLPGDYDWKVDDSFFRSTLRQNLKEYIVVRNREPLKPWTRLAFENIHRFGITYYPWVYARLIEDDGTEFDSTNALPLYGNDPGVVREDYRRPGITPQEVAAQEARHAEVSEILEQRELARQNNDSPKLAEIDEIIRQRKLAVKEQDEAKLAEIRAWFERVKQNFEPEAK